MSSRSDRTARPAATRPTFCRSSTLPARQGTQIPQDSSTKNCMKSPTMSIRSRSWLNTMKEPLQDRSSKASLRSASAATESISPEGPLICTARGLSAPTMSSTSRKVTPHSTS